METGCRDYGQKASCLCYHIYHYLSFADQSRQTCLLHQNLHQNLKNTRTVVGKGMHIPTHDIFLILFMLICIWIGRQSSLALVLSFGVVYPSSNLVGGLRLSCAGNSFLNRLENTLAFLASGALASCALASGAV
jgi:hypothetical protein